MAGWLLIWTALLASTPENWSGFRGNGTGVYIGALPTQWSPESGIAWRAALPGIGQSAPIVWGETVYVSCVEGDEQDTHLLQAIDLRSGQTKWTHRVNAGRKQKNDYSMARAASTPVADASGVYLFCSSGELVAIDHAGKERWQRNIAGDFGAIENRHGHGASLAHSGDVLFLLVDDTGPSYLVAINKEDGETQWKQERTSRRSWTSPVVLENGPQTEVIVSSNGSVDCYQADDGTLLWSMDDVAGNAIVSATPVAHGVLVGGSQMRGSTDASKSIATNRLVRSRGKAGSEVVWKAEKALAHYASPLSYRGHAYFVNRVGVLFCLDLANGQQVYAERIAGECWASPIAAGDYLYFFGKKGETSVVKAGPAFEVVATNSIGSPEPEPAAEGERRREDLTHAVHGVAAGGGRILVRTGGALICIGQK